MVLRLRGGVTNLYNYFTMRLPSRVWRDQRVRETVAREDLKRKAVKAVVVNQRLDLRVRLVCCTSSFSHFSSLLTNHICFC